MSQAPEGDKKRRRLPLMIGGGLAAMVLVLGATGTLSTWTQAIITNDTNTTRASNAVALSESDESGTLCVDTATTNNNSATCQSVNKYGGTATPLEPGASSTTRVTLANTGSGAGSLTVEAGECAPTGGPTGSTGNLCDHVQVTLECPAGTVRFGPATLTEFDAATNTAVTSLAPGASVDCSFIVALDADAPSNVAGQIASQPIVWTLTAT